MADTPNLFDKTYDQQVEIAGENIRTANIRPNRRIPAEVVLEPVLSGIRVTARDEHHHMLWGFVGSTGMMTQIHTPVAVYDTLRAIVSEELAKQRLPVADTSALAIGIETKATIGIEIEATPAQSRTLLDAVNSRDGVSWFGLG